MAPAPLPAGQQQMSVTAFDFSFPSIEGTNLNLSDYQGRVLLIVNTASRCGFTRQYSALQNLWSAYRKEGLVVIGVPSNDFGGQELGTEAEVKQFCEVNFDIDFPMTAITEIKGADAHEFYKWAGAQVGMLGKPKWNFHKFLVGRDGQIADWFSSVSEPDSPKFRSAIEQALAQNSPS
jgi:glutathione peroxidase